MPSAGEDEEQAERLLLRGDCEGGRQEGRWRLVLGGGLCLAALLAVLAWECFAGSGHEGPGKSLRLLEDNVTDANLSGLTFVTCETDANLTLVPTLNNFSARTGKRVHNVGTSIAWKGFKSKVKAWKAALVKLRAELGPEDLAVLMDSRDILWGGCGLSDFRARYESIVAKQGAPIVFSSQLPASPGLHSKPPEPPAEFVGKLTPYINGCSRKCNGTWHDMCSPCGRSFTRRHMNSGFVMGPIGPIMHMLDFVLENYADYNAFGDQTVFSEYRKRHPDRVTLDYGSELCMTMLDLGLNAFTVDAKTGVVASPYLGGRPTCFLHGYADYGRFMAATVLYQLNATEANRWVPDWAPVVAKRLKEEFHVTNISTAWVTGVLLQVISLPQFSKEAAEGSDNSFEFPTEGLSGGTLAAAQGWSSWVYHKPCPSNTCAAMANTSLGA